MRSVKVWLWIAAALGLLLGWSPDVAAEADNAELFNRDNLVAWCVVPFDAKKRGPEARAEMLTRAGIFSLAYDWRAEHIPTFDEEMETLKRWGINLKAFWFPGALNEEAKAILDVLARHGMQTELWVTMHGGEIECTPEEHAARVAQHVDALRPLVDAAAAIGCKVGLYNHGGWFGEPENQIEILKALGADNVGLVYNLHHGHGHLDRLPALLAAMKPYLYCLNLNGMVTDGDQLGNKIVPLGNGDRDLEVLRAIRGSGYAGPIGVLGHTMDDAEETLLDNLDGLEWLLKQLDGADAGPRPALRVGRAEEARGAASLSPAFGQALAGGMVMPGDAAYRTPPITVELRARLHGNGNYNILAANDTKASGNHWEIFTEAGTGHLAVYVPGRTPNHLRTTLNLCDDTWHSLAMHYGADSIRLYVDGAIAGEVSTTRNDMPGVDGGFAMGRLVEGGFFCDGEIDDVRVSRGLREPTWDAAPRVKDGKTIALWDFDDLRADAAVRTLELEDPERRAALPLYQTIPAARTEDLTPALDVPATNYSTWTRSHGDAGNTRFSADMTITRENVVQLTQAWVYHSGDGAANIQCNPIVVDGVIYAPTAGNCIVAIDGATGAERWRFDPGGKPAFRGLTYWPGAGEDRPRLLFTAGEYLYAINPADGTLIATFGEDGRVRSGESRVAGAVYESVFVLPSYAGDVYGIDVRTGALLWTFHTIPRDGEYGRDTWDAPEQGANCWGGMAMDRARGIAYVSTGSPKPNFAGNTHLGQNLFSNCVIALDARRGERLWHFQEIRHDIWDLDIPAPPNLVTVTRDGTRYDAVAQTTKMGNTLLLDRGTGAPLFPFRMRRAPVSKLPGERTWPYQPDVALPEPFARRAFSLEAVTNRTPVARNFVMSHLANANYGWFEPFEENVPTALYGFHGGAEWSGAAYDPESQRLYVSGNHMPWIVTVFREDPPCGNADEPTAGEMVYRKHCVQCHGPTRRGVGMNPPLHGLARRMDDAAVRALLATGRNAMPKLEGLSEADTGLLLDYLFQRDCEASVGDGEIRYTHNGYPKLLDDEGYPGVTPPWGTLNCIDLNTGKIEWRVPLGYYPELAEWGEDDTGAENFGGPSVTAGGLVFCAGTPDLLIRAFDAENGGELWSHPLPFGGYAPPTIYAAGGRTYVLIAATGGGKLGTETGDAYVAFALPAE